MNKRISKLLIIVLMSSVLVSPLAVNAEEVLCGDSGNDAGYVVSEQTQIEEALKLAETQEQIDNLEMKLSIINTPTSRAAKASYPAATISVKYYQQEEKYFCGPATTKQTIQYMNGSSDSQKKIARALDTTEDGTDGTRIVEYLNKKQSKLTWTIAGDLSASGIKLRLSNSITGTTKRPPIMRARFSKKGSWRYPTRGHFMNISGYKKDMTSVRITDPNIGRVIENHSGTYYVTFTEARDAIINHPSQHLYW